MVVAVIPPRASQKSPHVVCVMMVLVVVEMHHRTLHHTPVIDPTAAGKLLGAKIQLLRISSAVVTMITGRGVGKVTIAAHLTMNDFVRVASSMETKKRAETIIIEMMVLAAVDPGMTTTVHDETVVSTVRVAVIAIVQDNVTVSAVEMMMGMIATIKQGTIVTDVDNRATFYEFSSHAFDFKLPQWGSR